MSRRGKDGVDWEYVYHAPEWIPAPVKINYEGDTKPGFLCIHEWDHLAGELCSSWSFERTTERHMRWAKLRGRWNFSRPCYDKVRRCPGWAGGGWKGAKNYFCSSGTLPVDYEGWWKWKTHRCPKCRVVVLPYMVRWTDWQSWWLEIRYFRSRSWFYKIETKIGRWFGKW